MPSRTDPFKAPGPLASPTQLRERAESIRWAARTIQDEIRTRQLLEFADQLDAEAKKLEADASTASGNDR